MRSVDLGIHVAEVAFGCDEEAFGSCSISESVVAVLSAGIS